MCIPSVFDKQVICRQEVVYLVQNEIFLKIQLGPDHRRAYGAVERPVPEITAYRISGCSGDFIPGGEHPLAVEAGGKLHLFDICGDKLIHPFGFLPAYRSCGDRLKPSSVCPCCLFLCHSHDDVNLPAIIL